MKESKASQIGPKRANIDLLNVEIWNITILRRFIHILLLYACIRCLSNPYIGSCHYVYENCIGTWQLLRYSVYAVPPKEGFLSASLADRL